MKKLSVYLDQNTLSTLASDPAWAQTVLGEALLAPAIEAFVSPVHLLEAMRHGQPRRPAARLRPASLHRQGRSAADRTSRVLRCPREEDAMRALRILFETDDEGRPTGARRRGAVQNPAGYDNRSFGERGGFRDRAGRELQREAWRHDIVARKRNENSRAFAGGFGGANHESAGASSSEMPVADASVGRCGL